MDIRKFSLRNFRDYPVNLHWLILLATVPGFIALALISFLAYQGVRERLESELTHTVRALTLAVDRELSGELLALHALAASSALASERLDGFYQEAKNFQSADSVVNHIVLTDRSGQELVNTLKPFGSPLPRTNNMERIDRVFATASSSVSKLLLGTSSGTHVIVVDTPVMRDGHVIYDLAMVIDPAKLGSILKSQHLPESWGAGIVDQEGVLIARTPNPERFVGRRAAPSWLELSAKHREGTVEALSLDGIPVLGAFCHSEVTDYTVGIAMPMAAVRASLARSVAMASLGVASLIATGFWIAMRLNRRILKSIRSIADAALAAEHGQLDTSLSVAGPAELTQLSEQIGRVLHSRHDAELHLARTNRALRLVSECIGALVHATDEHQLLAEICSHVVATGGYQMAWVGYPEHDPEKTVRPVAHAGNVQDYFAHIQVSWGDGVLGLGPTGTAIRTGSTQVNQNTLIDPRKRPWRQAALDRGYASSIALPLASEHEILGALTIYAAEADAFQGVEIELLEQLAADLAFGIAALRSDALRQQITAEKLEGEARYRLVLDHAADAVLVANPAGSFLYANQQASRMLGYPVETLLRMSIFDIVPVDKSAKARELLARLQDLGNLRDETALIREDGSLVPVELNAVRLPDGNLFGAWRDISDRKGYEKQLKYRATHDPLTGLANRELLTDRMEQSISHAQRSERCVCAMLLDLDRFKLINDSLGHRVGDQVIQVIAKRLTETVRAGDTIARLGGDEFMVIVSDLVTEADTATLARKLLNAVSAPMHIGEYQLLVTASLGLAIYPRDGVTADGLFKSADAAMYRAKDLGRNSFQFYAPEMNARMTERLGLENGLRHALEHGEFEIYYQPKVELGQGRMRGAEALIRWNHPSTGLVSPADFIPLAEETGLIVPIGVWVIETVCRQLKSWQDGGLPDITVSVNISARQFQQADLVDVIDRALRSNGLQARHLELEVTESAVMTNVKHTAFVLRDLKKLGISISLDDFGTGYSSLSYLKQFPIDSLKIDQAFIRDMVTSPDDAAIARMIITLAHSMKHRVIAEGVETQAQLSLLRRNHCDEVQGYLYSRPVSANDFTALLREDRLLELPEERGQLSRTLLIVDDEPNILTALKRLFHQDNYLILTASNAIDALELLARQSVQVIIADEKMPDISGTEFLSRVYQMYPETIRLLLTGSVDIKSITEAINRGAILKFMTKPWDSAQLKAYVQEAFRSFDARNKVVDLGIS